MQQNMNLSMTPYNQAGAFVCSQYDIGRECQVRLTDESGDYTIPTGATVTVMATKPSGLGFSVECTWSGSTVTFATTETMTNEFGRFPAEIRIEKDGLLLGSTNFYFKVEKSPHPDEVIDGDVIIQKNLVARVTTLEAKVATAETDITDLKADIGDLEDLETTDKSSLVEAINEAAQSGGGGLTEDVKQALLDCFENVAWIGDDGQDYYDALEEALYPPANLTRITAVYTQSGTVYDTDSLDSLKSDLVVTAHYDDSSSATVTTYALSGTLAEGTSTIVVSYGEKTTTFNVTVTKTPLLPTAYQQVEYIKATGTQYIATNLKMYDYTLANITAEIDFAFDEWQSNYTTNIIAAFGSSYPGLWIGYLNSNQNIGMGTTSGNYFTTGTVTDRHSYAYSVNGNVCTWTRDDGAYISRNKTTEPDGYFELFYHIVNAGTQNDFHFNGKLYSCVVYENNVEVLHLYPCYRISDGEIGLYDTVNNRFYTNDGTGTFLKGGDVA